MGQRPAEAQFEILQGKLFALGDVGDASDSRRTRRPVEGDRAHLYDSLRRPQLVLKSACNKALEPSVAREPEDQTHEEPSSPAQSDQHA